MAKHSDNVNEVDSTTDKVQRRRLMKHMVEKRRRNRINGCLENMRKLVLKAQNKNPENYTKMEKADILEMTTNFLLVLNQQREAANQRATQSNLHRNHSGYDMASVNNYHVSTERKTMPLAQNITHSHVMAKEYSQGYATCQAEISNYLNNYKMTKAQSRVICSPTSTQGHSDFNKNNINSSFSVQHPSTGISNVHIYSRTGEKGFTVPSSNVLDYSYIQNEQSSVEMENSIDMDHVDVEKLDNVSSTVSSSDMWRPW